MDRFVVMVDAGYLLRQAVEIVSNRKSRKRAELTISDAAGLIRALVEKSRSALDLGEDRELLRIYWYDGVMSGGHTLQQREIISLPDVHFRGGTVNSAGQQKGVDSLIVTDLIELASNHAICDAALVTGDSDLAVGIELAQKKGVRIAVVGLEDLSVGISHNQSFEITSRADRVCRLGGADLSPVMRYVPAAASPTVPAVSSSDKLAPPSVSPPSSAQSVPKPPNSAQKPLGQAEKLRIDQSVKSFIAQQASLSGAVDPSTKRIIAAVDRALIHHVVVDLNHGLLTNQEKIYARNVLKAELGV